MSATALRFVYEQFGPQKTDLGTPPAALPTAPSARVPVGPAAAVPAPDLIRTSTARPKPTNAVVPVARRADEQVEVGEPLFVAADRERLPTVATLAAVNAKIHERTYDAPAPRMGSFVGRTNAGVRQEVAVKFSLPEEVARWRPEGVCINAELTADELSGDFRDQSDRLVNVGVSGPTPLLKATRERVGTRVYVLLIREATIRFVPVDAQGTRLDNSSSAQLVAWLEQQPRAPTEAVCEEVSQLVRTDLSAIRQQHFFKLRVSGAVAVGAVTPGTPFVRLAWWTTKGWWAAEEAGWKYRFVLKTALEIERGDDVPSDAVNPERCVVVRAWPFGKILDNNFKLRGEQASVLHVCVGAPLYAHDAFDRFVGAPDQGVHRRVLEATVLAQIGA